MHTTTTYYPANVRYEKSVAAENDFRSRFAKVTELKRSSGGHSKTTSAIYWGQMGPSIKDVSKRGQNWMDVKIYDEGVKNSDFLLDDVFYGCPLVRVRV